MASYVWTDPAAGTGAFPEFPGATVLREQSGLLHRAYAILQPKGERPKRVLMYESDASLEAVAAFYAKLYASGDGAPAPVQRGTGDLAADELALAPLLAKLGHRFTPGIGKGAYSTAQVSGGPGRAKISIQRPWRDFIGDRVVDTTLILVSE